MRSLTRDDVLHVAKLAKLDLTNEEVARFQRQLSKIVDYISQLSEIDTSSLEPISQTTGLENVFRKDEVKPGSYTRNGYFVVNAILDKKS